MSIWQSIKEGAYSAKVMKIIGKRNGLNMSSIPRDVKDTMLQICTMYHRMGYDAKHAADLVEADFLQHLRDIQNLDRFS